MNSSQSPFNAVLRNSNMACAPACTQLIPARSIRSLT